MFPVSHTQNSIRIFEQTHPGTSTYFHTVGMSIEGKINEDCLREALKKLMERHEILRSKIVDTKGIYNFAPQDPATLRLDQFPPLRKIKLSKQPIPPVEDVLNSLDSNQKNWLVEQPFDFKKGPLWRVGLIQYDLEHYQLVLVLHHIIVDVNSQNILLRDLSEIYNSLIEYRKPALPQIKHLSSFNYAHDEEDRQRRLAFWKEELRDLNILNLHTDFTAEENFKFKGNRVPFQLDAELMRALNRIADQSQVTLNTILLASIYTLLNRYSGEQDICIGLVSANRQMIGENVNDVVNCFINSIPFRMCLDEDKTLSSQLSAISHAKKNALTKQLPLDILMREAIDTNSNAINNIATPFNILCNFNNEKTILNLQGTRASPPVELNLGHAKVEYLGFYFDVEKGFIEFNTDLFKRTTIERLITHFLIICQEIAKNPHQQIKSIPLLSNQEKEILDRFHDNVKKPQTIEFLPQIFSRIAKKSPHQTAIVFHGANGQVQSITYSVLEKKSNDLALYLIKNGIGPDQPVGCSLSRSINLIIAILAIMKAGGVVVPLEVAEEFATPTSSIFHKIRDNRITHVLVDAAMQNYFSTCKEKILTFNLDHQEIGLDAAQQNFVAAKIQANHLAYIMYTSGSTGKPKGVEILHGSVSNLFESINDRGLQLDSRVLSTAPPTFDAFFFEILEWLSTEGELHLINDNERLSPKKLETVIHDYQINCATLLPESLRHLHPQKLPSLRDVISMGAMPKKETLALWHQFGRVIRNEYGPTEATICTTVNPYNPNRPFSDVGVPIRNNVIYILDKNLNECPPGVRGQIYIGGAGLARGYLGNSDATAEKFPTLLFDMDTHHFIKPNSAEAQNTPTPELNESMRLYPTGDLGCYVLEPDNSLSIDFLGREGDAQIKIQGVRVEIEGIKNIVSQHPKVNDVYIMLNEAKDGLIAYVIPKPHDDNHAVNSLKISKDELHEFLQNTPVPYVAWPQCVMELKEFPLTKNGKIDHKRLPQAVEEIEDLPQPETPLQEELLQLWSEILHKKEIHIRKTFQQHGGSSLQLADLESCVNEKYDLKLMLNKKITITTLATLIQKNLSVQFQPAERISELPCSFFPSAQTQLLSFMPLSQLNNKENKNRI